MLGREFDNLKGTMVLITDLLTYFFAKKGGILTYLMRKIKISFSLTFLYKSIKQKIDDLLTLYKKEQWCLYNRSVDLLFREKWCIVTYLMRKNKISFSLTFLYLSIDQGTCRSFDPI